MCWELENKGRGKLNDFFLKKKFKKKKNKKKNKKKKKRDAFMAVYLQHLEGNLDKLIFFVITSSIPKKRKGEMLLWQYIFNISKEIQLN